MIDRDYHFWIATFTSTSGLPLEPADAVARLIQAAQRQCRQLKIAGYELYRDIGDVELQTDAERVRTWEYCLIAELQPETDLADLIARPPAVLQGKGWSSDTNCLTSELAVRPAGAGTAIPRAPEHTPQLPARFTTAIEYIQIPDTHWLDYKNFMREVFGPLGRWLIDRRHSHKIIITERLHEFWRDPSMPAWNRVHVLTGDFDSAVGGFVASVDLATKQIVGPDHTVTTALAPVSSYRKKPRMSKNVVVCSEWPRGGES